MTVGRGSLLDIQTAIVTALTADAGLMTAVTGVFDNVPIDQLMPYVEIGEGTENKFNTFDSTGKQTTMIINVWSGYAGFKEAETIMNIIIGILDYQTLTIPNYNLVYFRYGAGDSLKQVFDGGKTRRVSGTFEIIVQQT
jgi:hypothetical protein